VADEAHVEHGPPELRGCTVSCLYPHQTACRYGDAEVRLSLGGAFHAGRLGLRASGVGTVSPARSARRTTADRLALALDLLRDPVFDVVVTGESRFDELPASWRAWPRKACRRSATRSPTTGRSACSA
jgi:hypothetical protein